MQNLSIENFDWSHRNFPFVVKPKNIECGWGGNICSVSVVRIDKLQVRLLPVAYVQKLRICQPLNIRQTDQGVRDASKADGTRNLKGVAVL